MKKTTIAVMTLVFAATFTLANWHHGHIHIEAAYVGISILVSLVVAVLIGVGVATNQ